VDLPFSPRVPYADFTLRIDERRWMEDPTRALLHALGGLTLRRLREMRYVRRPSRSRDAHRTRRAPAALAWLRSRSVRHMQRHLTTEGAWILYRSPTSRVAQFLVEEAQKG